MEHPIRILLVEDNPDDVLLLEEIAKEPGAGRLDVAHTDRIESALRLLESDPRDAVLLDMGLPDAQGLEGLHRLQDAAPRAPIILLTGNDDDRTALEAVKQGAQDYLVKDNLEREVLVRAIRYAIERKRAEEELRLKEQELRQAHKLEAIGQLAAGIAHEINTPMQFIGDNLRFFDEAFADLKHVIEGFQAMLEASREGAIPEQVIRTAEAAVEAADLDYLMDEIPGALEQSEEGRSRVTKIVRAMKEFSHPGSGEKAPADLNKAVDSTLTVCRNEWKYVADVVTDFDPALPAVPCYLGDLNQVILNLVTNAAQAIADVVGDGSRDKGKITVRTRALDGWAEIRVSDTGTGIPEDLRDRIFDPFFTTKKVGKGTGQGLAISYGVIVDKHGGTIEVESETGRGTTFIIRLPLEDAGQVTR